MNILRHGIIVVVWLCLGGDLLAQPGIAVHFRAPGVTHITFSGSAAGVAGGDAQIQLVRINSAHEVTVLEQATGPSVSISGTRRDAGLGNGTFVYQIRVRTRVDGEWSEWVPNSDQTFQMTALDAQGTLLFDEILGEVKLPSLLTVPEDRKLRLDDLTATDLLWSQLNATTNLLVFGELTFGSSFAVSNVHVVIAAPDPATISGINATRGRFTLLEGGIVQSVEGGTFIFGKNGRAESTIGTSFIFHEEGDLSDATGDNAAFYGPGSASFCRNMNLYVQNASNLSIANCSNVNVGVGTDCIATITDTTINTLGLSTAGTATRAVLNKVTVLNDFHLSWGTVEVVNDVTFDGTVYISENVKLFKPDNTKFNRVVLQDVSGEKVEFTDCLFAGPVDIYGGSPIFTGCEFGKLVEMYGQNAAVITGCRFLEAIQIVNGWTPEWSAPREMSPVIEDNAFLGGVALSKRVFGSFWTVSELLTIGANYYGHEDGFVISSQTDASGFLQNRRHAGAVIQQGNLDPTFSVAAALTTSPLPSFRRDRRVLPSFWINGVIHGQGTIDHQGGLSAVNIKGRESLLSVQLMCSDDNTRGARVYVDWGGTTVETIRRSGLPVHRHVDLYRKTLVELGVATYDFVLPGVQSNSHTGLIWLDSSGIQGFDPEAYPPGPRLIGAFNLSFEDPPARPLRIAVVPVEITGLIGTWGEANPADVMEQLRRIPDMLPLPASHLDIDLRPVHRERSPSGAFQLGGIGTLNWLTSRFAADRGMKSRSRYFRDTAPDFYVLVLPRQFVTGYFSGVWDRLDTSIDGAMFNSLWRNRIVLVAEHKPTAALHELGHCVGLNLGSSANEQYNQYPPSGLPIQSASIRAVESGLPTVRHLAGEQDFWFSGFSYYDIMGNNDTIWTRSQTAQQFHQWFQENLIETPSEFSMTMADRKSGIITQSEPTRRMLLSAIAVGNTLEFVSLRDVALHEMDALPPPEGYAITLAARNAQDQVVYESTFRALEDGIFLATFDLPTEATSIQIYDADNPGWVYFESESAGLSSTTFVRPLPGALITDALELQWSFVTTGEPSNVWHSLYYRTSPAEHWQTLVLETAATNLTLGAEFLPASATPELLLITSDGIRHVSNTVTIATSAPQPQPPQIQILSPVNGDTGDTNTFWTLTATSRDSSGAVTVDPGEWVSSLDGVLGTGRMGGTLLSVGTHVLSYSSAAANGLAATATVSVVVHEAVTGLDLSLDEDDLSFVNATIDPTGLTSAFLWPGTNNVFSLRVRNQGVDSTVRATLEITPQGGSTLLLGTVDLDMFPFETRVLQFTYIPGPDGAHTARAQIELLGMTDPVPSNNVIEKTYYAPVGITVSADPPEGGTVSGQGIYGFGAEVTVRAFTANNFLFAGWREHAGIVSTQAVYSFTTGTRRALVAVFEPESTGGLFAGGAGTIADPFRVATAEHLNNVRLYPEAAFRQTANISLAAFQSGTGWAPIECEEFGDPFTGTYDGAGYKITALFSDNPALIYAGLFGSISGARLENIEIENANVTGAFVAGILAGSAAQSTIINCRASGNLRGRTPGGLVGTLTDTVVQNCHADVSVYGGALTTSLGGLSGIMTRGRIEDSSSKGWINPESNLTGASGGLVGKLTGTGNVRIERSWSLLNITNAYENAGGLVGLQESGLLVDSFARGDIYGGYYSGGIAGHLKAGVISNCFAAGLVQAGFFAPQGGVIGRYTAGQIHASYYDSLTTGQEDNGHGFPRTTAQMTYPYDAQTYVGWNFTTVWKADTTGAANHGYPYLADTEAPEEPTTPNGIAISWLQEHGLPTDGSVDLLDPHHKRMTLVEQYIADTDPNDPADVFRIKQVDAGGDLAIRFRSSARRLYTLLGSPNLAPDTWTNIPGGGPRPGVGGDDVMRDTNRPPAATFYQLNVGLPDP